MLFQAKPQNKVPLERWQHWYRTHTSVQLVPGPTSLQHALCQGVGSGSIGVQESGLVAQGVMLAGRAGFTGRLSHGNPLCVPPTSVSCEKAPLVRAARITPHSVEMIVIFFIIDLLFRVLNPPVEIPRAPSLTEPHRLPAEICPKTKLHGVGVIPIQTRLVAVHIRPNDRLLAMTL